MVKKKKIYISLSFLIEAALHWDSDGAQPSALGVWYTRTVLLGISGSTGHRWGKFFGTVRWCSKSLFPWDLPTALPVGCHFFEGLLSTALPQSNLPNHLVTLHEPVPPLVFSSLYMWHQEALFSENCVVLVCLKPSGSVLVLLTALSSTRALASCSQRAQFELWDLGVKTWFVESIRSYGTTGPNMQFPLQIKVVRSKDTWREIKAT